MRSFLAALVAIAICLPLTGCQTGAGSGTVDMTGSICVGGICITAPTIGQTAPAVPNRVVYDTARAVGGPVALIPPAPTVMAVTPVNTVTTVMPAGVPAYRAY